MTSKEALEIIKELAGEEAFAGISRRLSGETVYFPTDYEWADKTSRNVALKEDFFSGGYEISDLARKYNLSISRVYKIIQHRE